VQTFGSPPLKMKGLLSADGSKCESRVNVTVCVPMGASADAMTSFALFTA